MKREAQKHLLIKMKEPVFEIIHVCSYSFGFREVKAGDEAWYICTTNILEDSYY